MRAKYERQSNPNEAAPSKLEAGTYVKAKEDFICDNKSETKIKQGTAGRVIKIHDKFGTLILFDGHEEAQTWVQPRNFTQLQVEADKSGATKSEVQMLRERTIETVNLLCGFANNTVFDCAGAGVLLEDIREQATALKEATQQVEPSMTDSAQKRVLSSIALQVNSLMQDLLALREKHMAPLRSDPIACTTPSRSDYLFSTYVYDLKSTA
jgi:hypothetical protein